MSLERVNHKQTTNLTCIPRAGEALGSPAPKWTEVLILPPLQLEASPYLSLLDSLLAITIRARVRVSVSAPLQVMIHCVGFPV